ncbi:hypothetical protein [Streptomyces sp. YIM S03343]
MSDEQQPRSAREKLVRFAEENEPNYGNTAAYDPETGFQLAGDEYLQHVNKLLDEYAHEIIERTRRGVAVMEESLGAYQCAKDVRDILDVVDPTTQDPGGWDF